LQNEPKVPSQARRRNLSPTLRLPDRINLIPVQFFFRINAFAGNIDPGGKLRSCGEMELKTSPRFALLLP
jgi:hypothetical protein